MENKWVYFSSRYPVKDSFIDIMWTDKVITTMDFDGDDVIHDDYNRELLPVKWRYKN